MIGTGLARAVAARAGALRRVQNTWGWAWVHTVPVMLPAQPRRCLRHGAGGAWLPAGCLWTDGLNTLPGPRTRRIRHGAPLVSLGGGRSSLQGASSEMLAVGGDACNAELKMAQDDAKWETVERTIDGPASALPSPRGLAA